MGCALRMMPKLEGADTVVPGVPRLTMLKALLASPRNCRCTLSVKRNVQASARSTSRSPRASRMLRPLFSTFPDGSPGLGLLCLRVGTGIALIHCGVSGLSGEAVRGLITVASDVIAVVTGILLLIGLWTPIAGAAVAILELSIAALATRDPSIHLLLAAMGAGLAMLGPGAWSIDSRLFGRKRLDIPDRIRGR